MGLSASQHFPPALPASLSLMASQAHILALVTVPTLSGAELTSFQVQSSMIETDFHNEYEVTNQ